MIKYRTISTTDPSRSTNNVFRVKDGGTEATSVLGVKTKMNLVTQSDINVPNGIVVLNDKGKIPISYIHPANIIVPDIDIPSSMELNTEYKFKMSNLDFFIDYDVSISAGTIERNKDKFTVRTPDSSYNGRELIITINGHTYCIPIQINVIAKPVFTNLHTGDVVQTEYIATTSNFSINNGTDTHYCSSWQIAKDEDFDDIVYNVKNSTTNLTTLQFDNLEVDTVYYIRVKYGTIKNNWSEWSTGIKFTTKKRHIKKPNITIPKNNQLNVYSKLFYIQASPFSVVNPYTANDKSNYLFGNEFYYFGNISGEVDDTTYTKWSNGTHSTMTNYGKFYAWNKSSINSSCINTEGLCTLNTNCSYYTHTATDWEIASDPDFIDKVYTLYNNTEYLNYLEVKNIANIKPAKTYYVRCRYKNTGSGVNKSLENNTDLETLGESGWSNVVCFTTCDITYSDSDRHFYRHSSAMGTVVVWKDKNNTEKRTLVLDAAYRTIKKWDSSASKYSENSGYINSVKTGNVYYTNSEYYLDTGTANRADNEEALYPSERYMQHYQNCIMYDDNNWRLNKIKDDYIKGLTGYWEDSGTSKSNTTNILTKNNYLSNGTTGDNVNAANYCRNIKIDGVGCDLPNIQTLIRIYSCMFELDEADPTSEGNGYAFTTAKKLSTYGTNFKNWTLCTDMSTYSNKAWSSTEYNYKYGWYLKDTGYIGYNENTKTYPLTVIPVMDIN